MTFSIDLQGFQYVRPGNENPGPVLTRPV